MDRNRFRDMTGDRINAILTAVAMSFEKEMRFIEAVLLFFCLCFKKQQGYCPQSRLVNHFFSID